MFSDRVGRGRVAAFALPAALIAATPAGARVLQGFEEALAEIRPGAVAEKHTLYLDDAQRDEASRLAGLPVKAGVVHAHRLTRDGKPDGWAFLDLHRVRTLPETVLVVVDAEGALAGVRVLAFAEPPDYLPPRRWYDRFTGRKLDDRLALGRDVDGVSGATLTSRAAVDAARRALAFRVLAEKTLP